MLGQGLEFTATGCAVTIATLLELARVYRIDPKELIDLVLENSGK